MTPINALEAKVKETVLRLPLIVGNAAVNWTLDSFRIQGFRTVSAIGTAWAPRKDLSKKNAGRAVLVKTGRLRRSYRILALGVASVTIGSDLVYAGVHNNGFKGTVAVKGHARNNFAYHKEATGKLTKTGKARMKTVQTIASTSYVKPHSRKMDIPRRQAMPTDAKDSPVFVKDMEAVIIRELKQFF